ncbi:MAG: phosphoribosyltransferase family protein [Bacteroidota bacterium]
MQALVHRMKYQGFHRIGYLLGKRVGDCVAGECPVPIDFIVPVPLHRSKVRERGYNQSVHIARGVAAVTGWRSEPGCIERKRYTPSQTHLNAVEREANVAGAFVVPSSRSSMLAGASVLLVDDIVTTGATMRATALALREAGAQRVVACAIALAR